MPMPHEYVSNKRRTITKNTISFIYDEEFGYEMQIQMVENRGPVIKHIPLSKDDIKALYLILDDVVRTF